MSLEMLVEAHHRLMYSNNVTMVAQQLTNPFLSAVTVVSCTGEAQDAADLVGEVDYEEEEAGNRRNPDNPVKNDRRWLIFPTAIRSGQYIETEDKFKTATDPTSKYVRAHTAAVNRGIQDRILGVKKVGNAYQVAYGGILGRVSSGKRPGGAVTDLPASSIIAHNSTGLTLPKLIKVRENLGLADFGIESPDPISCAITPKQVTDLLNIAAQTQTSLNAFQIQQLQTGKPTTLLGFNWIQTNRLPRNAAGKRICPVWTKGNIVAGFWEQLNGKIWNDSHADEKPVVRVRARVDATRVEDEGVYAIECEEAA